MMINGMSVSEFCDKVINALDYMDKNIINDAMEEKVKTKKSIKLDDLKKWADEDEEETK